MPIYAYRCAACGHARDVLQKISEPRLIECPVCGASRFEKQLTAAGFQLKGSGWYATDFRNNNGGAAAAKPDDGAKPDDAAKPEATPKTDGVTATTATPAAPAAAAAATTAAPAAVAGGCQ